MTWGPSRTVVAPAASRAAVSSGLIPPSGPTTTASARGASPGAGRRTDSMAVLIGVLASSCRTSTTPPPRTVCPTQSTSLRVSRTSSTSGTRARRACLAAWSAVACQRWRPLACLAPCHTDTQRSDCQGSTSPTPTSVAVSTACSSRPPLARA